MESNWRELEPPAAKAAREAWKELHSHDPAILFWMIDHPAPAAWEGDAMDWAYTEMPQGMLLCLEGLVKSILAWLTRDKHGEETE